MNSIDTSIQIFFAGVRTPDLIEFFYLLTVLFDLTIYFVLLVVFVAILIRLVRNSTHAVFFLLTMTTGAVAVYLLKIFFNTSRPLDPVFNAFGQSFPSYHAALSTVFFIMLMYIFDDYFVGVPKKIFHLLCIVAVFLVSFSRIYLGVHWFSDVFFGVLVGGVISYLAILIFRRVR